MPDNIIKTVEIQEPETKVEVKAPSREDLKSQGWSAKEIDSAEKRGMLAKPEEKKAEPVVTKKETTEEPEPNKSVEPEKISEKKSELRKTDLPDFTISDPAKEKVFLDTFGPGSPQRAMYFRMKNERQARQRAESERDKERQAREDLEKRFASLENGRAGIVPDPDAILQNGEEDPENKPLTLKQLLEIRQAEIEEHEKVRKEESARINRVTEAQVTQEEYARSLYPDFDDTVKRAADVIQNVNALFPEKWKQAKVVKLIKDLQVVAANADKIDLDDYNAAMIAYELGQLHPDYSKANGSKPKETEVLKDPKVNGGLTPEQMKRIEENTQRRASSASVPGSGGRRVVSADDVTLADLNKMGYEQRQKFRTDNPERYAKLLRG